jgi:hypothetical protein
MVYGAEVTIYSEINPSNITINLTDIHRLSSYRAVKALRAGYKISIAPDGVPK